MSGKINTRIHKYHVINEKRWKKYINPRRLSKAEMSESDGELRWFCQHSRLGGPTQSHRTHPTLTYLVIQAMLRGPSWAQHARCTARHAAKRIVSGP